MPKGRRTLADVPVSAPTGLQWLTVKGARQNNLKGIDVQFPLGRFIAVTGVSGSGKSSLVNEILRDRLARDLNGAVTTPGEHDDIVGVDQLDKVIDIDQSPIGRTPRSNPATYIKLFDRIRDLYAQLPESKTRGYKLGRFSFNVPGGRCEACEGNGSNRLEMDFLADLWVTCPLCEGRRFNRETLQVRFKDKSIHDVLEMDVQEALDHFSNLSGIAAMLQTLHDVGLDYIKLGQPSPTLSGGEAQRIKLARELCKRSTGRTLYILDEPTTGLHFEDIRKLLQVLHGFVDAGNTVVVIEHNLDVIKTADWCIDLGPEGGAGGGRVVAEGTPEQLADCKPSHTGRALKEVLKPRPTPIAVKKNGRKIGQTLPKMKPAKAETHLVVEGARQHNLKDVSTRLPLRAMSIFSGPSGSGKSSLAIDTLYAEGQRRYVESLSSYARQFLGQKQKPIVERITGLAPAICIEQKSPSKSPRSTVGTVTEIYDYLRVLAARLGQPFCPDCQIPIGTQTSEEIIDQLLLLPDGTKLYLLAPIDAEAYSSIESMWTELKRTGFVRVRVDQTTYEVANPPKIDRRRKHLVEVVVDRAILRHEQRSRLADSVEAALDLGKGVLHVAHVDADRPEPTWKVDRFSQHFACDRCGRSFEELTPNHFSFNTPIGWCRTCEGLGTQAGGGDEWLSESASKTLRQGAVAGWPSLYDQEHPFVDAIHKVARAAKIDLDRPLADLAAEQKRALYYGSDEWIELNDGLGTLIQYKGIFPAISEATRLSSAYRSRLSDLVGQTSCSTCSGSRLRRDAGAVRLFGRTLFEWSQLPLEETQQALTTLGLSADDRKIAGELLTEVQHRLQFLLDVGLGYLSLGRGTPTLSGGEAQRIRLGSQLGSGLTGVLYLLDEPTIGLHPRDNHRLLGALQKLRDLGNTLVIVEHDKEVIEAADHLVDFGPGSGRLGGTIVAEGPPKQLLSDKNSLTGQYLSGSRAIPVPTNRRSATGSSIEIIGAAHHNLQRIDVNIPLGCFVAVTGVSGSGKSSLVNDVLWANLARRLHRANVPVGLVEQIKGIEAIDKVIAVDQQPIGNAPSSNAATYTGLFDLIRELFAQLPDAKVRGYHAARFSFNKPGGRCEACEGNGQKKIELHFLPDVWVECEVCLGKRYTPETLAVQYHGRSINDVLNLSAGEALELFGNLPKLRRLLQTLCDVGLDYLPLGQSAPTLSGGESQRVKLAAELARPNTGKTLYVLDEPTTGLHFDDIRKLLDVLHRLVDLGNTVLVIEHNLDLIKTADWVIDLGPEAGDAGGQIVAVGTPEEIVSRTGVSPVTPVLPLILGGARGGRKKKGIGETSGRHRSETCATEGIDRRDAGPTSHTAIALAPVLAAGPFVEREIYDPTKSTEKKTGDLEIHQVGQTAAMPWEIDGRRWHTQDRVTRLGRQVKWEGSALDFVVEQIQELGKFAPTNWNDRQLVEITAEKKTDGWFFHALTGEEWMLRLKFQPGKGAFKQYALDELLGLGTLDDLKDVPLYGRTPRVRVKPARSAFQYVEMVIHRKAEVESAGFAAFLKKAVETFTKATNKAAEEGVPWTADGERWHRSTQGFKPGRKVYWDRDILDRMLTCIGKATPTGLWDWNSRDSVKRRFGKSGLAWARLVTKGQQSLDLHLIGPKGAYNLAMVDHLGADQKINTTVDRLDTLCLRFQTADDWSDRSLIDFLAGHAAAFVKQFKDA